MWFGYQKYLTDQYIKLDKRERGIVKKHLRNLDIICEYPLTKLFSSSPRLDTSVLILGLWALILCRFNQKYEKMLGVKNSRKQMD